jgi:hypothetical protein
MELAGHGAHDFLQAALVCGVDVLVAGLYDKRIGLPLRKDLKIESVVDNGWGVKWRK